MSENIEPRVIKRYSNRKLYDTIESRYVTLEQIADLIRAGEDVRVVDNNSKEDLTAITLAQILFEEEKKRSSFLSLQTMRNIIQGGGQQLMGIVQQKISVSAEKVGRVFRHDSETADEAPLDSASGDAAGPLKELKDFMDNLQHTVDDWQKRLEASVQHAIENISPLAPLQKELLSLSERLVELENKVSKFEQQKLD